ncbi:hypothetical protein CSUI_008733 [Cystoisospora suis]|uniref:Uncharacterized protein n=1 Tax=Cystoisospora suis TaxID=483139 RepID=A0A2C6KLX2_9APIC|nr:hypothetical protein CSUI_008733 [Cystoisospora suis]
MRRLQMVHQQVIAGRGPGAVGQTCSERMPQRCCCTSCTRNLNESQTSFISPAGADLADEGKNSTGSSSCPGEQADPYSEMLKQQGRDSAPRIGGCPFAGVMAKGVCPVTGRGA